MGTVIIDGQKIEIDDDQPLNGIEAAKLAGIDIPHFCWHPGLSVVASCRMCLVETGRTDPKTGEVSMLPKLVPACQTPATDGTVFLTNSDKVKAARAMVEEDLLVRHPIDCPVCDKAGECHLQDYHFLHGQPERRADIKPFHSRRRDVGRSITLFVDRCVMCTRCVRFCREVTQTSELMVVNRGAHEEIDVFPGFPLDNRMSGNVVDLCPVGALGDKDFLYSQRVWFMTRHAHVCSGCSTGCSVFVEENQDRIYRIKPRENPNVNRWWMCDEGRYGWKHVHDRRRLVQPRYRDNQQWVGIEWAEATNRLNAVLRSANNPAVVLSPHMTVEQAYLLATHVRQLHPQAALVLGYIPLRSEDTAFPNGLTIRGEKCPNRRGVQEVANGLGGEITSWDAFLERRLAKEQYDVVWIAGGYKKDWNGALTVEKFSGVDTLIVQELFASPLTDRADWQLPAAASFERSGSFVSESSRLQSFVRALRPPQGVMAEEQFYWQLAGREGLYNGSQLIGEIARAIPYFEAAVDGVPELGVDLRVNQLA